MAVKKKIDISKFSFSEVKKKAEETKISVNHIMQQKEF